MALTEVSHDFIHVHTKVPDEAAHKGGPEQKKASIAALDRGLADLVEAVEVRDDLLVAVTADHSTPSRSDLIHSGEPVPAVLVGSNVRRDDVTSFDEISAAKGCLGFLRGSELMSMMLNYADQSCLVGHRLGGRKSPHVPKTYEPFKLTN
jgi:2,3-bisphosphoglycerate-independent phosphoglycerate mutase